MNENKKIYIESFNQKLEKIQEFIKFMKIDKIDHERESLFNLINRRKIFDIRELIVKENFENLLKNYTVILGSNYGYSSTTPHWKNNRVLSLLGEYCRYYFSNIYDETNENILIKYLEFILDYLIEVNADSSFGRYDVKFDLEHILPNNEYLSDIKIIRYLIKNKNKLDRFFKPEYLSNLIYEFIISDNFDEDFIDEVEDFIQIPTLIISPTISESIKISIISKHFKRSSFSKYAEIIGKGFTDFNDIYLLIKYGIMENNRISEKTGFMIDLYNRLFFGNTRTHHDLKEPKDYINFDSFWEKTKEYTDLEFFSKTNYSTNWRAKHFIIEFVLPKLNIKEMINYETRLKLGQSEFINKLDKSNFTEDELIAFINFSAYRNTDVNGYNRGELKVKYLPITYLATFDKDAMKLFKSVDKNHSQYNMFYKDRHLVLDEKYYNSYMPQYSYMNSSMNLEKIENYGDDTILVLDNEEIIKDIKLLSPEFFKDMTLTNSTYYGATIHNDPVLTTLSLYNYLASKSEIWKKKIYETYSNLEEFIDIDKTYEKFNFLMAKELRSISVDGAISRIYNLNPTHYSNNVDSVSKINHKQLIMSTIVNLFMGIIDPESEFYKTLESTKNSLNTLIALL